MRSWFWGLTGELYTIFSRPRPSAEPPRRTGSGRGSRDPGHSSAQTAEKDRERKGGVSFKNDIGAETNSNHVYLCGGNEGVGGADAHGVSPKRVLQILPRRALGLSLYQSESSRVRGHASLAANSTSA